MVLDQFSLVPLLVGESSPEAVSEVLVRLWGGRETLIVVSSDLSHYYDYATAKALDQETSRNIEALRSDISPERACGCMPLNGLLYLAKQQGFQVTTLDLRNSGDTAGPRDQVVGYGAYAIH
jgi:AmmeMemoRadiSam system protein B